MTRETDSKILEKLTEWEAKEGALSRPLGFYRRLLCVQSKAKSRMKPVKPGLNEEVINARIKSGTPLLKFADLRIDWALLRDVFEEITALFASHSEYSGDVPKNLSELSSYLALEEVAQAWYEGASLSPWMAASGVDEELLGFVLNAALRPFLISHSEALSGALHQEQWRRGYCPVCGGSPDFAFLDKEQGARWLLCSRCDAEWLFQRLECPSCGSLDQGTLVYFTNDEGLYRLYVCEKCRHYLKAVDLRRTKNEVLLPLERFLTLNIDNQALQKGYSPCSKARTKT